MTKNAAGAYSFLLETYETEILKISSIWSAFPESKMDYRPHPKSRSVIEQMEHQVQSEGRWMTTMLICGCLIFLCRQFMVQRQTPMGW